MSTAATEPTAASRDQTWHGLTAEEAASALTGHPAVRLAEPNRGFAVNGILLVGALVAIPLVIGLLTAIPAWRAAAAGTGAAPARAKRRRPGADAADAGA